jgi:signal transduction histidine kinase
METASAIADTYFAPAGRDGHERLIAAATGLDQAGLLRQTLDAIPAPALILNDKRQVLLANRAALRLLQTDEASLRGMRPGEIVQCVHAASGPDGCGTGLHCRTCGVVGTILDCLESKTSVSGECRLTIQTPDGPAARDLRVSASPCQTETGDFVIVVLEDISKQKRLEVLSRTFFHDVLNTAGGIRGFAQLLEDDLPPGTGQRNEARQLARLADTLVDEIQCQRDLTKAEDGELAIEVTAVQTFGLLNELRALYAAHDVAVGRTVILGACWTGSLLSDARLLNRVLGNMIKNAVEATPPGEQVTIRCEDQGRQIAFSVHNPTVMPEHVKLQVFQRSFSTKGEAGRGIGTYSIKLFGETYLGGEVSFVSEEPHGTTFTFVVPKVHLA